MKVATVRIAPDHAPQTKSDAMNRIGPKERVVANRNCLVTEGACPAAVAAAMR
jgi:hypothetical protein